MNKILLALILGSSFPLAAAEFKPVVEAEARGGYASVEGGPSSGLWLGSVLAVPAFKFEGGGALLPTLIFNANGQERLIEEDGRLSYRSMLIGFKPAYKFASTGSLKTKARLEAKRSYSIESLDEAFGTGLYDYEQFGFGGEWGFSFPLTISADGAHRGYPNYRKTAIASMPDKNVSVKDYYSAALKAATGVRQQGKYDASLSYRIEIKSFTDSIPPDSRGAFDGPKQSDTLHSVEAAATIPMIDKLALRAGYQWIFNDSNMALFDTSAIRYFADYQDYFVNSISVTLLWDASAIAEKLRITLDASLQARDTKKPVQESNGAYTDAFQSDLEMGYGLNAVYPLPWQNLSLVLGGAGRNVKSNQQLARGSQPSYSFYNVSAGFAWSFE